MKRLLLMLLLLVGAVGVAVAEDSVTRVSYFADPYGNNASFWTIVYQGKPYSILKIKSPEKTGEADFLFDDAGLAEFESKVAELRRTPNQLKADGFKVLWSTSFGEGTVKTLLGRLNGIKVKLIQVTQRKANQAETEHQVSIDECYSNYSSALSKLKKARAAGPK